MSSNNNPTTANTTDPNAVGASGQDITTYMANQAVNPTLSNASTLTPVLQQTDDASLNATGQLLQSTTQNTIQPGSVPSVNPQQVNAAQTNSADATSNLTNANTTYQASTTGAAQGTAAQMTVNPNDTVQGQLQNLYASMQNGQIPPWAQAAVTTTTDVLASRGLKVNSSIGAGAITAAVQNSAINIAAADASTYFQTDVNNFNAQQQTSLANTQNYQQSLLSNQAAENAAAQFNASSTAQVQEFTSNLVASINDQNANRVQAASVANQNVDEAAQQFNSQQEMARQTFNAQNQFAIDQSNVQWRRQLNTANTAAVNAANQVNVQNSFNLSTTAMNNLWQQFNDEASWAFTASEDQQNRDYNLAIISNNQSFVQNQSSLSFAQELGSLASSLLFTK